MSFTVQLSLQFLPSSLKTNVPRSLELEEPRAKRALAPGSPRLGSVVLAGLMAVQGRDWAPAAAQRESSGVSVSF